MPKIADIGEYSMLNYSEWPNIKKITQDSDIAWLDKPITRETQKDIDARLDLQYTLGLWRAANELPSKQNSLVVKIIKDHIVFQNILWAIRLKKYYNLKNEEISEKLVFDNEEHGKTDILASSALSILDKPLDSWDAWKDWQYVKLINPNNEGAVWHLDPSVLQKSINMYLNNAVYKSFRKSTSSAHLLIAWYKIKKFELDSIRTYVEGLRLNVDTEDLKRFML